MDAQDRVIGPLLGGATYGVVAIAQDLDPQLVVFLYSFVGLNASVGTSHWNGLKWVALLGCIVGLHRWVELLG